MPSKPLSSQSPSFWVAIIIIVAIISAGFGMIVAMPRYHTTITVKSIDCNWIHECKVIDTTERGFRYNMWKDLNPGETYNITYSVTLPDGERTIADIHYHPQDIDNRFNCVDVDGVCK